MNTPETQVSTEQFRYLMWTVSVIVGLGITTLLRGVGQLLTTRVQVRFYLPHICYVVLLFVVLVEYWWGMWQWNQSSWEFWRFLFALLSPAVLYLVSVLLLPEISDRHVDLEAHFYEYQPWFFRLGALATILSIVESYIYTKPTPEPTHFTALNGLRVAVTILFAIASTTRRKSFHYWLPLAFVVLLVVFIALKQADMSRFLK